MGTTPKDFTVAIAYNNIATSEGIPLDASGNAYIGTNSTSSYVTKLSPAGAVLATSATGGNGMNAVAVDSNGGVWATALSSNAVYAYTSGLGAVSGSPSTVATGNSGVAVFNAPTAVATDNSGFIYVTDGGKSSDAVVRLTGAGTVSGAITSSCFTRPTQIALDASATIWATISSSNGVCRVSQAGATQFSVSGTRGVSGRAAIGVKAGS